MTFPFATVVDYFAGKFLEVGLPAGPGPAMPLIFIARVDEAGQFEKADVIPDAEFFLTSQEAHSQLADYLRRMMDKIATTPNLASRSCVVIATESLLKASELEDESQLPALQAEYQGKDLSFDPSAIRCMNITVHRPEGIMAGYLEISPDRKLSRPASMPLARLATRNLTYPINNTTKH